MLNLIVCMDKNRGIGKDNAMPWHLPNELKYFKKTTTGHVVVMGRKTYESIGRPLSNRVNVAISNTMENTDEVPVYSDIEHFINTVRDVEKDIKGINTFVIGGASIYEQFLPYADRLYITVINAEFDCDTFFPDFDIKDWRVVDNWTDEDNGYDLEYLVIDRHKKE